MQINISKTQEAQYVADFAHVEDTKIRKYKYKNTLV